MKLTMNQYGMASYDCCPPGFQDVISQPNITMTMSFQCCGPKTYTLKDASGKEALKILYDVSGCCGPQFIIMYDCNEQVLGNIDISSETCTTEVTHHIFAPSKCPVGFIKIRSQCCGPKVLHALDQNETELYYISLKPNVECCSAMREYSVKSSRTDEEVAHVIRNPMKTLELQYATTVSNKDKFLIFMSVVICDISEQTDEDSQG